MKGATASLRNCGRILSEQNISQALYSKTVFF